MHPWIVLFDVGIDVLDVIGHDLAQAGDLALKSVDRLGEQAGEGLPIQVAQDGVQMAYAGHSALNAKTVGHAQIQMGTKAQFEDEQRMIQQVGPPAWCGTQVFTDAHQERFDVGRERMGRPSWTSGGDGVQRAPIKEGEELAIALHDRVGVDELAQGGLVKVRRKGYDRVHGTMLLSR